MGYCGGETPDPTYRKVCASGADRGSLHPGETAAAPNGYAEYAETIQLEFDEAQLSYADVLDAFFRAHDAERRGKSRQCEWPPFDPGTHSPAHELIPCFASCSVRPERHLRAQR